MKHSLPNCPVVLPALSAALPSLPVVGSIPCDPGASLAAVGPFARGEQDDDADAAAAIRGFRAALAKDGWRDGR